MARCEICERDFTNNEALEMHNKSKHPEKEKKPLFTSKQKKKIRNYGLTIIVILAIIGFFWFRSIPPKDAPIIEISQSSYNFGSVSQAKGAVTGDLTIKNSGVSVLIINGMDTSCGCTSATLVYQGEESPRFSMANHGTNPRNFALAIPPGEVAQLKIQYDPNVHREMRGAVTRSVYIMSNDPRNSREEVRIHVNQVD